MHPPIHPSSTANSFFSIAGEPEDYPREHRAQGGVHPGQGTDVPSIHPSSTAYSFFRVAGEPGAYPWEHQAQGGVHPEQGDNPLQGTITYTFTHPFIHYGHFRHANQTTM
ncbi:hypothetical protein AMELA_G00021680 [Ameiurus melas]|uniref:Uncharacterized protein n=1 Tax=Ameiurus melas TaxID=219545 RepID=A0A7J6BBQ7_AMEME|nr:hypothetical protein AMELA_G00021680 [Ameiurus melas]